MSDVLHEMVGCLEAGKLIPYLGPGIWPREGDSAAPFPTEGESLAESLARRVAVPSRARKILSAAAQYIESQKHRKTLRKLLLETFSVPSPKLALHDRLASLPQLPLIVDVWYDGALRAALGSRSDWGEIQGVSQAEHPGSWTRAYRPDGTEAPLSEAAGWGTVLYKPFGSVSPAANFVISDSDLVEVLTEIDIQTPIPPVVQERRRGSRFLFIGCRFSSQTERSYARQILKRSSDRHWASLPEELSRNEERFLQEMRIERISLSQNELCETLFALSPAMASGLSERPPE
ncbi:SIR2 family protein [Methylacidimicrobium sp. B4]|uniref:SIR2 family NAD-dependent protein deacylase n=1 Tax=Methylacidimicrobium sp. B4 TaxID=2796139 RepID=UPI001A8E541A|nr:SIR2 family protein [Methylacidimicrobium sp. B4]QSR85193.1 SIR2 family protein [Methylacidimicrobium sp. B4]